MCGGTFIALAQGVLDSGLSPRVRGNLHRAGSGRAGFGSIPACAGEPPSASAPWRAKPVYPRVCGGTLCSELRDQDAKGLSPRVRGNRGPGHRQLEGVGFYPRVCGEPRGCRDGLALHRSIPACAGEPVSRFSPASIRRVYPRVCGGISVKTIQETMSSGLSPRVRGTGWMEDRRNATRGLSPRVRGNHRRCAGKASRLRSIPRVRGNPGRAADDGGVHRSIPACAGEPACWASWASFGSVYPRVCGGTTPASWVCKYHWGLSPRVRGNRPGVLSRPRLAGSIPACAGEPS